MKSISPFNLVLRCYARHLPEDKWYGVCLDLNLAAEAESLDQLKAKMNEVILSYIETVLDTDDKSSIPSLIRRPAPLADWVIYYWYRFLVFVKQIPRKVIFEEFIPFHLAHGC